MSKNIPPLTATAIRKGGESAKRNLTSNDSPILDRIQVVLMMADIDITSGDRSHATDAQYRAIAQRLLDKVVAPERLAAAVMATPPSKKASACTCEEGMACSDCPPASGVVL